MTTSKPRQAKTPRQRAEETLAVAQRRVTRLEHDLEQRHIELAQVQAAYAEAEARLDYARKDPALATPAASSTDTSGGTTA